ncbi:MAG: family 10 glycosylhydrolase [candidate division KSB1 bacterium]|nr:family 10 glycosylhydrolase [candidate division KSB1 bacterium]
MSAGARRIVLSFLILLSLGISGCSRDRGKPRFLWVDALANWEAIVSPGDIDRIASAAKSAGFTGLVVEVKPITGQVVYPSRVAPRLTEWKGAVSPGGFDYLDAFVRTARSYRLKVFASVNVFAGGHRRFRKGIAYEDHPDWVCVANTPLGLVPSTDVPHTESIFLQPSRRSVQEQNFRILEEILRHYPVDGVVLDRVYYPDLTVDFSEAAREAFERFLGREIRVWPDEVYTYEGDRRVAGPLFRDWLYFRAKLLRDFLVEARRIAKQVRPSAKFCLYVGAWYPQAVEMGLNWASPSSPFVRLWPDTLFRATAMGDLLDALFCGLLFQAVGAEEVLQGLPAELSGWYTVSTASDSVRLVVGSQTPVFGVLLVSQYANDQARLCKATGICLKKLDGVAVLDLAVVEKLNLWQRLRPCLAQRP